VHPGYKAMPKYVVSTTLPDDDLVDNWGETTILRSLDEVAALKETEGGPIIGRIRPPQSHLACQSTASSMRLRGFSTRSCPIGSNRAVA